VSGEDVEAKGEANLQAGAVRELAGRLKGDRRLEAKGLAQQVKGSVQKAVGAAVRAASTNEEDGTKGDRTRPAGTADG
jgi:uncharacterized protein YjbJ (UPF0337 family)